MIVLYIIILILLLPVLTFIFHKREAKFTVIYFDLRMNTVYSLEKFAYIHGRTFIGMQEYKNVMIVKDGEYIIYLQFPCYQYKNCIDNKDLSSYNVPSSPPSSS